MPIPPPSSDLVRMPSLDGLCAFEAAARLGSFERAAQELHITASAVSKRVGTVEDLLGTALFARTGNALTLTATGKEYLPQVRSALAMLAAMPLHRRTTQRAERLRVNAPPTFARQVLVPHLESFTQACPQVELELTLSIPYLDVSATEADVEVRFGDAEAHGGKVLTHDVVLPVAAPVLLARLPPMRVPADLRHAPLLRSPLEPWTTWFRAAGLDWPEPSHGPKLLDLGLLMEAAVSAQGIALARPTLAKHWLESGTLVRLFSISAAPAHQYHLLPHARTPAAEAFIAWLRALCERVQQESAALLSGSP
jgi:LysR family transcriptional regulator, glycine cleavage system transcriptional activator